MLNYQQASVPHPGVNRLGTTTPGLVTAKLSLAKIASDPVLSASTQASDSPASPACCANVASESRNEAEAIIPPTRRG